MGLLFGGSTAILVIGMLSLACLVLACITAPASSTFGLAFAEDIMYGTLGYCNTSTNECVVGSPFYSVTGLTSLHDWKMDDNARNTLAKILITIPVAAFLVLLNIIFNLLGHIKVIGHSFGFNIFRFVVATLAFFASAIACIITFLLFYPHVKWPAWLLIPAASLNLINIPLSFYVMRVTPGTDNGDQEQEEEDLLGEKYDGDLTDLTVNDQFKSHETFPSSSFAKIQTGNSVFEYGKSPYAVDVAGIDSSSNSASHSDMFKPPSANDEDQLYSRPSLDANEMTSVNSNQNPVSSHSIINEGTPNIVSPQNYGRANNAISEAPAFQSQTVKTETSGKNTGYSVYGSSYRGQTSSHYTPNSAQNSQDSQTTLRGPVGKPNYISQPTSSQYSSNMQTPSALLNSYEQRSQRSNNQMPSYPGSGPSSKSTYGTPATHQSSTNNNNSSSNQGRNPLTSTTVGPQSSSSNQSIVEPDSSVLSPQLKPSSELNPSSNQYKFQESSLSASDIYSSDPLKDLSSNSQTPKLPNTNVLGSSNHDSIMNEYDFENSDMNDDTGSDFTSVSQRPANPHYYKSYNKGPSLLATVEHQAQMYAQPMYQPQQQQQLQYQSQQPPPQQQYYNSGPPPQQNYQYQPSTAISGYGPSNPRPAGRDTTAMIINQNPDFAISGPAFQSKTMGTKRTLHLQNSGGGYKPAYRRTQPSANQMGPASSLGDSPYSFKPAT
ncbi:hypothetical protein WICPIJ_005373 [Wickerhamomyces pijperi]|uniref:Uncharacterized protein n=1 Tax=Wickerhamomyces pijperi TaxID=599730 RepID=A0A9P8TM15_WICPI|nr:hypothetical protein WICPIJ_005373 [Wickerhamomyces pijperi]